MNKLFDLSYRPKTYWPESLDREQLLSRIKGQARRNIGRKILDEEGFVGLNLFLAREALNESERQAWGAIHPDLMGGEFLPDLDGETVEIARISLASVTSDQISIRAQRVGESIRYTVADEYDTEFDMAIKESEEPLTLGELIKLIDESNHPEEEERHGLLVSHWEHCVEWGEDPEAAIRFAWIESATYPQLGSWYEQVAEGWCDKKVRQYIEEE